MTTDPERAANVSGTESVEDEDDNDRKILCRTDVLAALRDGITAPGLEVLQYYFPSSFGGPYISLKLLHTDFAKRVAHRFTMVLQKSFSDSHASPVACLLLHPI